MRLVRQGKIANCRNGSSSLPTFRMRGDAFIDRALYVPKEWSDDPDHLEAAYVPGRCRALTIKPKLVDENNRTRDKPPLCHLRWVCR